MARRARAVQARARRASRLVDMVERTGGATKDERLILRREAEFAHEGRPIKQPLATHRVARAKDHVVGAQHLDGAPQLGGTPRLRVAHLKEDVVVQALGELAVVGLEALDGVEAAAADHTAGKVELTLSKEVAEDELKKAVEGAGYEFVGKA